MEYPEEIEEIVSSLTEQLGQDAVEAIRQQERVRLFEKLRNLIMEKDAADDQIASSVLGWAYERLAD